MLCALLLVSPPSFAAVIIVANDEVATGPSPVWNASIDPQAYLSKYDYNAGNVIATGSDTLLVLPVSSVPEPSAVLTVMLGLSMLGIAARKQSKPF
nr:PEP-CTERM sorting domain-containing protein [uncultured Duganella sp.]